MKDTDNIEPLDRGALLRAAPMATLFYRPISVEAKAMVEVLLHMTLNGEAQSKPRQRKRSAKALTSLRQAIGAIAADLIRFSDHESSQGYCFRSLGYDPTPCLATQATFKIIIPIWRSLGLIEIVDGFQGRGGMNRQGARTQGHAMRLRATPALLGFARDHGIEPSSFADHFECDGSKSYPIVVRAQKIGQKKRGQRMRVLRCALTDSFAEEVRFINQHMENQSFVGTKSPQYRRTFCNGDAKSFSWDQGGRLSAVGTNSYQSLSPSERKNILINGEPVTELDIKASHLTIYCALRQTSLNRDQDPYCVPGLPRGLVKAMIVTAFGLGRFPKQWPKTYAKEYKKETGRSIGNDFRLAEAQVAILERHPILGCLNSSQPEWANLQFVEANIIVATVLELIKVHGITALPIHDSLLVPISQAETARAVLAKNFEALTGKVPLIEEKK